MLPSAFMLTGKRRESTERRSPFISFNPKDVNISKQKNRLRD